MKDNLSGDAGVIHDQMMYTASKRHNAPVPRRIPRDRKEVIRFMSRNQGWNHTAESNRVASSALG